jgi:hypothetical protein
MDADDLETTHCRRHSASDFEIRQHLLVKSKESYGISNEQTVTILNMQEHEHRLGLSVTCAVMQRSSLLHNESSSDDPCDRRLPIYPKIALELLQGSSL